jgi:hypothetical protein
MPADSMTNKEIYFLEHSNLIYVINYSISECGWGSITQRVNTMHDIQHGNLPPTGQMNNNKYYHCLSSNELYKKRLYPITFEKYITDSILYNGLKS